MRYAEVSVNSPVAQRRTFSYAVPAGLDVTEGQPVWVPFGERTLQGIVMELTASPAVEETREIMGIIEEEPVVPSDHLALACWISDYYLSPLFNAVSLMLPPGFERRAITLVKVTDPNADISSLTEEQQKLFRSVAAGDRVEVGILEKSLGKKKAQAIISQLVKRGLLARSYRIGPVRIKPKRELYISLITPATEDLKTYRQAVRFTGLPENQGRAGSLV